MQLKARLSRISNLKQQRERKQQLLKHIPSISRSLFTVASAVAKQPVRAHSKINYTHNTSIFIPIPIAIPIAIALLTFSLLSFPIASVLLLCSPMLFSFSPMTYSLVLLCLFPLFLPLSQGALGGAHASLLRRISANEVVEHTLAQHLTQFVEKHADMEELQEEEEGQRIPTSAEAGGDAHALRLVPWRPAQQVLTASIGGINMAFLPSILTQ